MDGRCLHCENCEKYNEDKKKFIQEKISRRKEYEDSESRRYYDNDTQCYSSARRDCDRR